MPTEFHLQREAEAAPLPSRGGAGVGSIPSYSLTVTYSHLYAFLAYLDDDERGRREGNRGRGAAGRSRSELSACCVVDADGRACLSARDGERAAIALDKDGMACRLGYTSGVGALLKRGTRPQQCGGGGLRVLIAALGGYDGDGIGRAQLYRCRGVALDVTVCDGRLELNTLRLAVKDNLAVGIANGGFGAHLRRDITARERLERRELAPGICSLVGADRFFGDIKRYIVLTEGVVVCKWRCRC